MVGAGMGTSSYPFEWLCRTGKPSAAEAEASAERMTFRKGPWWTGFGHLLHMPSHTFLRIGEFFKPLAQ